MYDAENKRFDAVDPILDASKGNIKELLKKPALLTQYTYALDAPFTHIDPTGKVVTPANVVGALVGAVGGYAIANVICNYFDLPSCTRNFAVGSITALMTVVGWFAGPAIYAALKPLVIQAIATGQLIIDKTTQWITETLGINTWGNLSKAAEYGLKGYNQLRNQLRGTGLQAHHIIEQRFGLGINTAVAVTPAEHQVFTNAWRKLIPYGTNYAALTATQVYEAAQKVYKDYPAILAAVKSALGF